MGNPNRILIATGVIAVISLGGLTLAAYALLRVNQQTRQLEDRLVKLEISPSAISPARFELDETEFQFSRAKYDDLNRRLDDLYKKTNENSGDIARLEKEIILLKGRIKALEDSASDTPSDNPEPNIDMFQRKPVDPAAPNYHEIASAKGRAWGPEQAAGPPDTHTAGDIQTAWASKEQNAGPEWLVLTYDKVLDISSINIYETHNPGAVVKVSAKLDNDSEHVIWEGESPPMQPPAKRNFTLALPVRSDILVIDLDTTKVPGWNEIDAVEIVDTNGNSHWAVDVKASSTYAER